MDTNALIKTLTELAQDPKVLYAIIALLVMVILSRAAAPVKPVRVNTKVKMAEAKVVDFVDCGEIEDMAQFKDGKLVMCRCWKSKTFPFCDGSHVKHNKETGDNLGPLIIKGKAQ
jgi:CDGSH-type Zn-finger protein